MDMGYMMGYGGFGMFSMLIFMLAFIGILLYLLNISRGHSKEEDPIHIIKKRYARGEISKEEMNEMIRNL